MSRSANTNYTASGTTFQKATAAADAFLKEDVQYLAAAFDLHDHSATRGLAVTRVGTLVTGLGFSGTALRITGDFSNATHATRVLLQSSTANGNTSVGAIPNGTGTATNFYAYGGSDPDNAAYLRLGMSGSTGVIDANVLGTGVQGDLIVRAAAGLSSITFGGTASTLALVGALSLGTLGVTADGFNMTMNRAANNYVYASHASGLLDLGVVGTTNAIEVAVAGTVTLAKALTITTGGLTVTAGNVGIGSAQTTDRVLSVAGDTTVTTNQYGLFANARFSSAALTDGTAVFGRVRTAAAAFTMTSGYTFYATTPSLGASSAITNQYGFYATSMGVAGVTNAYGVYIAAQSGAATTNIGLYNAGTSSLVGAVSFGAALNDANGNPLIVPTATGSAVNGLGLTNGATGTGPTLTVAGPSVDTNADLILAGRGTGKVKISASYGAITADSDGATVTFNMATSDVHSVTLGGNRTLAVSNVSAGQAFMLRLLQDGTGSRTVTWFTTIKWAGGVAPTLTTTASKADWIGFICTSAGNYDGFVVAQNV